MTLSIVGAAGSVVENEERAVAIDKHVDRVLEAGREGFDFAGETERLWLGDPLDGHAE